MKLNDTQLDQPQRDYVNDNKRRSPKQTYCEAKMFIEKKTESNFGNGRNSQKFPYMLI